MKTGTLHVLLLSLWIGSIIAARARRGLGRTGFLVLCGLSWSSAGLCLACFSRIVRRSSIVGSSRRLDTLKLESSNLKANLHLRGQWSTKFHEINVIALGTKTILSFVIRVASRVSASSTCEAQRKKNS